MSNFARLIYVILLALLLPYAVDLRASDLTLVYTQAQQWVTTPFALLSSVIQRGPGQGLTPSVRNAFSRSASPRVGTHRFPTLRVAPPVDSIFDDIKHGRFLAVLAFD